MKNKICCMITVLMVMMVFCACGKKTDDELIQSTTWQLSEITEEKPVLFPVSTEQSCLNGESFTMEFLSDGSIIINASFEGREDFTSEAYYHYSLVDGKLKIAAPLGSTCMADYEISKNELKLTDGSSYAVFVPYDSESAESVEIKRVGNTEETEAAEESENGTETANEEAQAICVPADETETESEDDQTIETYAAEVAPAD